MPTSWYMGFMFLSSSWHSHSWSLALRLEYLWWQAGGDWWGGGNCGGGDCSEVVVVTVVDNMVVNVVAMLGANKVMVNKVVVVAIKW